MTAQTWPRGYDGNLLIKSQLGLIAINTMLSIY
jgi:hypothetical protein